MIKRVISAAVMIAITLATLYFGGVWTKIFVLFITGVGTFEMLRAYKKSGKNPLFVPSAILFLPSILSFFTDYKKPFEISFPFAPDVNFYPILIFAALAATMIILVVKNDKYTIIDGIFSFFTGIYVTALFNVITVLRFQSNGFYFVLLAILGGIITDTFAMFSGMLFGKKKLCPTLSPNKTLAGSIGGFLGCILSCNVFLLILKLIGVEIGIGYLEISLLAIIFGILSQFGDLFASYMKRQFGLKDFGKIIPGHGGIIDRVDSFGILLPILYYFLIFAKVI